MIYRLVAHPGRLVGGTGSEPPHANGWHRKTLQAASADPFHIPWRRSASTAYRLHVGAYRQHEPTSGLTVAW